MFSAPTVRITSNPSIFGIWMSRKTRSGSCARMAFTASSPSRASPITSTSGWSASSARMRSRARGSSSTMSVRMRFMTFRLGDPGLGLRRFGGHRLPRQRDDHGEAAHALVELEPLVRSVMVRESGTCIRQANALTQRLESHFGRARAVILDFPPEHLSLPSRPHRNRAALGFEGNPVLDGVFDERLQHKVWDQAIERLAVDVPGDRQTVAKPCLFDLQVFPEKVDFLL